tara:strand:- start:132 stop:1949 length:1818 start_codon:yes stop_codon:yes gene_type:complete
MRFPRTKPRGKGVIPFGYVYNEETKLLDAIPGHLEALEEALEGFEKEEITSLRQAIDYIKSKVPDAKISHQTFSNYLQKEGKQRRQYNYHSTVKKARESRRRITKAKKEISTLETKLNNKKTKLKQKQKVFTKLSEDPNKVTTTGKIVDVESITEVFKDDIEQAVVFAPNEGPQTEFLAASETDVLYGGAAGGGKSYAMLVDPLRYAHRAAHRGLIIRRSMPELRELIDKSRELYPKAFPGCKYREVEKMWNFPSGAKIEFGFLERDADVYRYQGQAYSWIGFDEITHLPTEFSWNYLASRLRTTDSEIIPYMRCTANPGGVGAHWVKKRYIDPADYNESFEGSDGLTRKFIPAKLDDNPYLAKDGRYEKMLMALPPTQRKQLLEGNWDVNEGAAFTEFNLEDHVIPPFEIPINWERVKGIDYGYASESACVWATIDPSDGTLIVYRELYQKGLTGQDLGYAITEMELQDPFSVAGVLDTAAWNRTGTTGPTVGETLVRQGHKLRRADKNRIQGKIQIHEYLRVQHTGRPKIQIFNTCPNLIREIQSIPLDSSNPEDVDTRAQDHAYDALRYLIMSRPRVNDPLSQMRHLRLEQAYTPSDNVFGY